MKFEELVMLIIGFCIVMTFLSCFCVLGIGCKYVPRMMQTNAKSPLDQEAVSFIEPEAT